MPRRRLYESNAKKQRAYRMRKRQKSWLRVDRVNSQETPEQKAKAMEKAIQKIEHMVALKRKGTLEQWLED